MKIIHFSDAHIDFGANMGLPDPVSRIPGRVLDCLDMVDSIIDFAAEEEADLIIFAGDAFHRYNPNPLYANEFAKRIMAMTQICPVVLLVGNHDMSPTTSSIEIYDSMQIPNVIVGKDYQVHNIMTKSGNVQVATAPYPTKKQMAEVNDKIYALGDLVTDQGPAVLVGHFTVGGSRFGEERSYVINDEAEVRLDILSDPVWDYVALGHIHYHQCLNETPPVVYAGSIDRVTFGEEHEDKGFVLVTIENNETQWEFIQLDARPYKTVEISTLKSDPMPKIIKKLQEVDLQGSVVKVIVRVREAYAARIDKGAILRELDNSGLYILASLVIYPIRDVDDSESTRMSTDEFNVSMTPLELTGSFLDTVSVDAKERNAMLKLAREIIKEVNANAIDIK